MAETIELNGRRYQKPQRPTVVICVDGCDPEYLERGIPDGIFPTIGAFQREGYLGVADAVVPTFTNPNNVSIVTGAPPAAHGIAGNYYLDRESGQEIMMTDERLMRSETLLALMAQTGVRVAAVTAKDKLRKLLGRNLDGICFSSEYADAGVEALVGRGRPDMYSADLSLFVLDAGVALLERGMAQLLYLSLSDYVQHAHAPAAPEADAFNRAIDNRVGRFVELGAVVGIVADHGMNDKARPNGEPNVIFLEDELNRRFGAGAVRVICPITDPFVRHHGALGSFVRVYARGAADISALMAASAELSGVALVLDAANAERRFELPLDREGDFIVLGDANTAIGASNVEHDLSGLAGHRLRSHGGLGEQLVPFILSRPLTPQYRDIAATRRLRNYDIFDFVLNGVE
ncbi:MAG TPA: phosphonoacetate hydrolase [Stellaceae bacterium]|jgi:phosphonoacetate hydrolase|nr:phosphonoacetate hydrolase [Stellaceae bacterium]